MTLRRDGGTNQQKIDLDEIIDEVIERIKEIDESDLNAGTKTREYSRAADKAMTRLRMDGRQKDESKKIALSTYKRYMTKVRNAIKATGRTHHTLQWESPRPAGKGRTSLPQVLKAYPEYTEILEPLQYEHAETIGAMKNSILKQVQADKGNTRRTKAYKAIKSMATDHETVYSLKMDDVLKADEKDRAAGTLAKKKTETITMVHADILKIIRGGLKSRGYTPRAFALALASGRRAIEILFNAEFRKTGEHSVIFTGQAKKQTGIAVAPFEIYTLIPADEFIDAYQDFKKLEPVARLEEEFGHMEREERNTEINRRTAKTMNDAAKRALKSRDRVFKDSRTIYTRICTDTFYKADSKWNGIDEDVFVKQLLGHGATSTVDSTEAERAGMDFGGIMNYRQFVIDYNSAETPPEAPAKRVITEEQDIDRAGGDEQDQTVTPEAKELQTATRKLKTFIKRNPTRDGLMDYHFKVCQWTNENPQRKISFSALYKKNKGGIGGNRQTILDYMEVIEPQIKKYNARIK